LTEKIKNFKIPNLEEAHINKKIKKIVFCKKFIQEYISSLEYMKFSKASFQGRFYFIYPYKTRILRYQYI